jgi:hypothetical protein
MSAGSAQAWFIAGTIPLILAGGLHAVLTVLDTVHPRSFTPRDPTLRSAMADVPMRFGGPAAPSVWRAWLGFNLSHGIGVFTVGLICLLIAGEDFALVERIDAIRPIAIGFSATYLVIAIRFWFWGPVLITASATLCFTVATLLSA